MPTKGTYSPYLEARGFVRSLRLKNVKEWREWCKLGIKPINIPSHPYVIYKKSGWISWGYFLGTNNVIGGPRKHKVNDDYFKKWSRDMAYILGFWFADGSMGKYKGSCVFSISQHEKDKYLLEEILKKMKSDYLLTNDNRKSCSFRIASKTIYNDLIRLGGKERKSLDVKFPRVPKKYLSDFIRGLWDGDGSVYYCNRGHTYFSSYVSGSKDFINCMHRVLKENIPNLRGSVSKHNCAYVIEFCVQDTVLLKRFMYPEPMGGNLFLRRKYELFKKATERYNKCQKERKKLDYDDAQKMVSCKGFVKWEEWLPYCKSGLKPLNIPSNPHIFYKNKGWIDWPTWFGYPRKNKRPTKFTKSIVL